ncbi:hypothetical protein AB7C87_01335 [Natrarchaeobius sp. A-rgal3]|uniref:hypothetical protein n=1 Tax=Natrarchaeobius versutus TaxID=1679078 RepID=UPI0035101D2F
MSEEVPVKRADVGILAVVSVLGGVVLASVLTTPELTPQFANVVFVATMLLAFFLFIPVMGLRLFVDDWREEDEE